MTLEIVTAIEVNATPEAVWRVLTDFAAYPAWNPFIVSIAGRASAGERLEVRIRPAGGKPMTFRPRVLKAEPGAELRWRGRVLVPGLFDGEHYFRISGAGAGARITHGERFSGLLLPLLRGGLERGTRDGFMAMNEALKRRAEQC